jgi:GPH family glycoside/pentoside/hexuronide:cation symporter
MIVNAVTTTLLGAFGGWLGVAVLYAIVEFIMLIWCFVGCKEHIGEDAEGHVQLEEVPLKTALPALFKNKYFYLQTLLFLFLYIGVVSVGSTTYYFCNTVLGNLQVISLIGTIPTIPAIIANFISPSLVKKFGKRKTMIAGSVLMIVGFIIVGLAGTSVPVVLVGLVIKGFGMGPIMSGVFAMTADVVDYGEWKTGIRSEGLVNSCTSFGMKVGIGLGSAVCTWVLAAGGYVGTAETQTASAVSAIRFGFSYLGAIISVVCLVLILLMNIDKDIKKIEQDLQAKRA